MLIKEDPTDLGIFRFTDTDIILANTTLSVFAMYCYHQTNILVGVYFAFVEQICAMN